MSEASLKVIEQELTQLIGSDKTSWVKIFELMDIVEKEKLYSESHRSYTAWVNDFAVRNKVHVSLLWSRKKAGKMYSEYVARAVSAGKEAPSIETLSVSPDSLVLVEKIAQGNTAVADELTDKAIRGELGRADLQNAWRTVRASSETRVRVNSHDKNKTVGVDSASTQKDVNAIAAEDVVFALGKMTWIPHAKHKEYQQAKFKVMTEFAVQTGTSRHARRLDALVLENLTPAERGELALHGIEIKISKSDLLNDHKMQEYLDFVDYFWIAVPDALLEEAKTVAIDGWGILGMNDKKELHVVEKAKLQTPTFRHKTLESALMKLL